VFSFFSLASGLMAVYEFRIYAESRTPDPIYLNERLMLSVVLDAVQEQIGNRTGVGIPVEQIYHPTDGNNGSPAGTEESDKVQLFLREMKRTANAGMTLQLYEKGEIEVVEGKGKKTLLEEKGWLVEADLWARLRRVVEHGKRTVEVKVPPEKDDEKKEDQEDKQGQGQDQEPKQIPASSGS
jgi:hypothetical protein